MDCDPSKFYLCSGTVQPYVCRERPWFMQHFGCPVYDRNRPVLSTARAARAQPVVDRMNAGELSPEDGMAMLNEVAFW